MDLYFLILLLMLLTPSLEAFQRFPVLEKNLMQNTNLTAETIAVQEMLKRLIPEHAESFSVLLKEGNMDRDTVTVSSTDGRVSVESGGGVAASFGILHYLKYFCNSHISWEADQLNLPNILPSANFTITAKDRVRYYQNVCTVSYSSVWWQWPRWEREIDWMALNGINLPLAFTGQEAAWRRVYLKLGLTEEELQQYFTGPAFLAWNRMGNIMAWGGGLPLSWHNATEILQKKILGRMRQFGMTPVLPCFAGSVPSALQRIYPNATFIRQSRWNNFNDTYSRNFALDPTDSVFGIIGSMFIQELKDTYDLPTGGFYNCDPYNEMTPPTADPSYLRLVGESIFGAVETVDSEATWVLQGWMLHSNFWNNITAKALLTSVPQERMLVLDLNTGVSPVYNRFESFYGQPFVFCMLHNYGGIDGIYGASSQTAGSLTIARSGNNSLVGTGLTMEGINQNYVMYDMMMEMAWRDPVTNFKQWGGDYSIRRYGSDSLVQAWRCLMNKIYTSISFSWGAQYIVMKRPNLHIQNGDYPISDLLAAWEIFVNVTKLNNSQANSHLRNTKISKELEERDVISLYHPNHIYVEDHNILPDMRIENENTIFELKKKYSKDDMEISELNNYRSLNEEETFKHDLVDITRQALIQLSDLVISDLNSAFMNKSYADVMGNGSYLLDILTDLDEILGTSPAFLLGKWTNDATLWGTNDEEKNAYKFNALNQISLWGPYPQGVLDYASKQWSGLIENYTLKRWQVYVSYLLECLVLDKPYSYPEVLNQILNKAEIPFSYDMEKDYTDLPAGNVSEIAKKIYEKYMSGFTSRGFSPSNSCSQD